MGVYIDIRRQQQKLGLQPVGLFYERQPLRCKNFRVNVRSRCGHQTADDFILAPPFVELLTYRGGQHFFGLLCR